MSQPSVIRLEDYTPFSHPVKSVHLTFRLHPTATTVRAEIAFDGGTGDLRLDGAALKLLSATINGTPVTPVLDEDGLTVPAAALPDGPFTWVTETQIDPDGNSTLEGLYHRRDLFITQCEAEGFRRITYFPDRPDVMAVYTVRIEGDHPVLLSNGDLTAQGDGWAEWHDPWPKPCYLFALVAGDLQCVEDNFTTMSGRDVALKIWVRDGDQNRCAYAMDSLIRSMKWDEEKYGREYDLDLFQIVAVDDFNAGAMENKGLNIFNSKYVLASAETATDADFDGVESVIAHEYFHNWTGNRITCRDWFQLSLKEGLTVFRDQCFSADMRSAPVKRIDDVLRLRAGQFREDAGPLAHPVRPESYVEINNFYTATVYEKGAELIRMLREIVGPDGYDAALALYFERHDGQACTIKHWLSVFTDATGHDFTQFRRWYQQAGTPRVTVEDRFEGGETILTFRQNTPPTPGQPDKLPVPIPIRWGLLDDSGEVANGTLILTEAEQELRVKTAARTVPSVLRSFSAPVILEQQGQAGDAAVRLAHDTDAFNRWEAGRTLALDVLAGDGDPAPWLDGVQAVLADDTLDAAFRALVLSLPTQEGIAQQMAQRGQVVDPDLVYVRHQSLEEALTSRLGPDAMRISNTIRPTGDYSPDGDAPGQRTLANRLLSLAARRDTGLARDALNAATNMTDRLAALAPLVRAGQAKQELAAFHAEWSGTDLVIDKWFAMQTGLAPADQALDVAKRLQNHDDFTWKVPNRFRSLVGGLIGNTAAFHRADGASYVWLADWLIQIDKLNPMLAARMSAAFETWRRYDQDRQTLILDQLERIASTDGVSRDMGEMVGRMRAQS
ncbi:aminopeptidase N [Monaibacterium marinum]|uniref:Aminopeptidase N n=1 Tax=Pontivivens marinum TaxID=1690039 RepID=A0A2C9CLX1_9RHOB|nr:aminopeptidase N [Monaibacterium marinum]SOH92238.1 aminopeptidase N [Monaibacterium marinum]